MPDEVSIIKNVHMPYKSEPSNMVGKWDSDESDNVG